MGSEGVWGRSSRCWHLSVPAHGAPAVLWPGWFRQLHRARHCARQALGRHVDKRNIQLLTSLLLLTQAKRGFEFLLLSRPLTKYPRKVPYLDGHSSWGLQHHVGQDESIPGCDEIGAVFEIVLDVWVDVLKGQRVGDQTTLCFTGIFPTTPWQDLPKTLEVMAGVESKK